MLPAQRNKIDINSLSEEEQKLFRLYGKLPSKKDILSNKLKERKYFDSGDYALSKAGKASDVGVTQIGSKHPLPENIPHSHTPANSAAGASSTSSGVLSNVNPSVPLPKENSLQKQTASPEIDTEPSVSETHEVHDGTQPEAQQEESDAAEKVNPIPMRWRSQT